MTARVLWLFVNAVQALVLALWSAVWISAALVARLAAGTDTALVMARRFWAPALLLGAGVELQVSGLEELESRRTYLFAANHQSLIDIPVLFRALPFALCFVAKEELKSIPFLGWYMSATGMVFVDRRFRSRTTAVPRVAALLATCRSVRDRLALTVRTRVAELFPDPLGHRRRA